MSEENALTVVPTVYSSEPTGVKHATLEDYQTLVDAGAVLLRIRYDWREGSEKWGKDPSRAGCLHSDWFEIKRGKRPCSAAAAFAHQGRELPHDLPPKTRGEPPVRILGGWGGVGAFLLGSGLFVSDYDGAPEDSEEFLGVVRENLGEPLVVIGSASGKGWHAYHRLPEGYDLKDEAWRNGNWAGGDTRCGNGFVAVADPGALAAALRADPDREHGWTSREQVLEHTGRRGKDKDKRDRATRKERKLARAIERETYEGRARVAGQIWRAVGDGKEAELDMDALVRQRAAVSGTHPGDLDYARADVERVLKDARAARKRGELVPWEQNRTLSKTRVEGWCAASEYGCSLSPDGKPVLPMTEWGADCVMALLGYQTRINTRDMRRLEWRGKRATEGAGGYGELRGDDAGWAVKEAARLFLEMRTNADGEVYYLPWRLPSKRLIDWLRANCRGDDAREVDPFLAWVEEERWDGASRVDEWIEAVFVVEGANREPELLREASRMPLIGAASRALRPGAVGDVVSVLRSQEQGIGKSLSFAALFPDGPERMAWFVDRVPFHERDPKRFVEGLGGAVIGESGELAGMNRADIEAVKNLISGKWHRFRPSYGFVPETFPMHTALVGTTNRPDPLPDDDENRRWLVVQVVALREGGMEWLEANRRQIWAEALARARGGELARLPRELAHVQRAANEQYRSAEPLEERLARIRARLADEGRPLPLVEVREHLARDEAERQGLFDRTTTGDGGGGAFVARSVEAFSRNDQIALGKALNRLGCKRVRLPDDGSGHRPWGYAFDAPGTEPPPRREMPAAVPTAPSAPPDALDAAFPILPPSEPEPGREPPDPPPYDAPDHWEW